MSYIDETLTVEQYLAWKQEGKSDTEVLHLLNYAPTSKIGLINWKKKHGLVVKRKQGLIEGKITPKDYLLYRKNGIKNKEIAAKIGVSIGMLNFWIKKEKQLGNLPESTTGEAAPRD